MSYSARHQHDNQWVKLPVGGDGVHGSPNSLDDPLMTAREVQPMPQSTPTAAKVKELAEGPRSATDLAGAVDADPEGFTGCCASWPATASSSSSPAVSLPTRPKASCCARAPGPYAPWVGR